MTKTEEQKFSDEHIPVLAPNFISSIGVFKDHSPLAKTHITCTNYCSLLKFGHLLFKNCSQTN